MTKTPLHTSEQKKTAGKVRWLMLLPFLVFAGLSALFVYQLEFGRSPSEIPSVLINKPAPTFDLPPLDANFGVTTPDGGALPGFATSDFIGKVSVVNVWGSWCPTCRDEHPLLLDLTKDTRFELVGLAYKDEPANAAQFLRRLGNPFDAIAMDISGRVGIDWGVYGAPETFIVDRTGTIRYKHIGALTPRSLTEQFLPKLEEILAEPIATPTGS